MSLSVGIVGLPNVGKSTLFNALTKKQQAAAENYPFCTIEPNSAIVEVADPRLEALAKIVSPQQIIRATVEFTDIAGLVKGASKGEGLGNKFLANIRECDAILHVVRCFENDDIIHVQEGGNKSAPIDPVGDAEVIETELVLADMEQLQKRYDRIKKEAQAKPAMRPEAEACAALLKHLEEGKSVRSFPRKEGDAILDVLKELHFLTDKKVIYCANVADDNVTGEGNAHVDALKTYAGRSSSRTTRLASRASSPPGRRRSARGLSAAAGRRRSAPASFTPISRRGSSAHRSSRSTTTSSMAERRARARQVRFAPRAKSTRCRMGMSWSLCLIRGPELGVRGPELGVGEWN